LQQTLSTRSLDALFHIFALSPFSSIFDEVFTYSYFSFFWDKRNNTNAEGVVKMKELLSHVQFTSQCLWYVIHHVRGLAGTIRAFMHPTNGV